MKCKLLVSAAAVALVAYTGTATAGEDFTTLTGITAYKLSAPALAEVRGGSEVWVHVGGMLIIDLKTVATDFGAHSSTIALVIHHHDH